MLYAVLCYNDEAEVTSWTKAEDDAVMAKLQVVHDRLEAEGKLGPSLRLVPTTGATTLHKRKDMVIDGPFAETKEALLGLYLLDCASLDDALQAARDLAKANPGGAYEIRPVSLFVPGKDVAESETTGSYAK